MKHFQPTCQDTWCGAISFRKKRKKLKNMTLGDVKCGLQTTDHGDWVKLNGRLKSSLSLAHQSRASSLGFGTYIPDCTDLLMMQSDIPIGTTLADTGVYLTRENLPDVSLDAIVDPAGSFTPTMQPSGGYTPTMKTAGSHIHGTYTNTLMVNNPGSGGSGFIVGGNQNETTAAGDHTHTIDPIPDHTHTIDPIPDHTHVVTVDSLNSATQTGVDIRPKTFSVNYFVYLGLGF